MSTSKKNADVDAILKRHAHHYHTDMGQMPEALVQLAQYAPEAFDAYSGMRTALLKGEDEGAALPLKYKHLILTVLDCIRDEPIGVINHTRASLKAGLSIEELVEGILLGIIVYGMPAWGKVGRKAVDYAVQFEAGQAKAAKKTVKAPKAAAKPAKKVKKVVKA